MKMAAIRPALNYAIYIKHVPFVEVYYADIHDDKLSIIHKKLCLKIPLMLAEGKNIFCRALKYV